LPAEEVVSGLAGVVGVEFDDVEVRVSRVRKVQSFSLPGGGPSIFNQISAPSTPAGGV
jgi:hypothetical protein